MRVAGVKGRAGRAHLEKSKAHMSTFERRLENMTWRLLGMNKLGDEYLEGAATALLLAWFGRHADPTMRIRDALFVVTIGWFAAGFGTISPETRSPTASWPRGTVNELSGM